MGITGEDFVIVAASKAAMRGPTIMKAEDDKTRQLNKHTLMAFSGEAGDTGELLESFSRIRQDANPLSVLSAIRRVHPSEYPTLFYAK